MKKLMIMGAGIYQVPLIKTAKKMGIHTIVVSIPGDYPGFALADQICYENTVDFEAVLKVAREENIDGIVTAGTDVAVITIGRVCDALGLRGLSFSAAEIASNKLEMKERYEACGVRTARFRLAKLDGSDLREKVAGLSFPLIFKVVDSSGSRGIRRVDSETEFDDTLAYVAESTHKDYFLVEEFIEGEEFGAQAFVQDGKVEFILPHGDFVFKGDTGVPVGHFAPYDLPADVVADCKEQLVKAVRAMGLDNCAINADFILRDGKTYVLELGGRSGATCLAELVSLYYGFDYYEKLIRVAMGEKVSFESDMAVPNVSKLLMSDKDGMILSQTNDNEPSENLVEVQFDHKPGDFVHAFHVGPHRIGHVITRGKTLDEAEKALEEAMGHIHIEVQEQTENC